MVEPPLAVLETLPGYQNAFTDLVLWAPFVRQAVKRQTGREPGTLRVPVPGTYPTFIADEKLVIKFFGRLFDGAEAYAAEVESARLLALDPVLPTPRLLGSGSLSENAQGWPWPYLIFDCVQGSSIGEVYDQVPLAEKLRLAGWLGACARRLHNLPLPKNAHFAPSWESYRDFLAGQRADCLANHQAWKTLPAHLLSELPGFLSTLEEFIPDGETPHLIHADLTRDHILGRWEGEHWQPLSIIDFGDARVGSRYYELAALHLDLFAGDIRLLQSWLDGYAGSDPLWRPAPRLALSTALLHQFDVLHGLFTWRPELARSPNLTALADALWDMEADCQADGTSTGSRPGST